jgi:DNA-directed RNA polymerase subunit K/omega
MAFSCNDPDTWLPEYCLVDATSRASYAATTPLTKFERATVLGHRALQIAQNSRARVATTSANPLDIAREELLAGSLPAMSIGRFQPDGSLVRRSVHDIYRAIRQ